MSAQTYGMDSRHRLTVLLPTGKLKPGEADPQKAGAGREARPASSQLCEHWVTFRADPFPP